jgi:hypothetical protein
MYIMRGKEDAQSGESGTAMGKTKAVKGQGRGWGVEKES